MLWPCQKCFFFSGDDRPFCIVVDRSPKHLKRVGAVRDSTATQQQACAVQMKVSRETAATDSDAESQQIGNSCPSCERFVVKLERTPNDGMHYKQHAKNNNVHSAQGQIKERHSQLIAPITLCFMNCLPQDVCPNPNRPLFEFSRPSVLILGFTGGSAIQTSHLFCVALSL